MLNAALLALTRVLINDTLSAVEILEKESFPTGVLEGCTSLDKPQVEALKAALTQKIAIIQGPPGTGNV